MNEERGDAIALANCILDKHGLDPDGSLCLLSRQFLRETECSARLRSALAEAMGALEAAQPFVEQVYLEESGEEAEDARHVFKQIAAIIAKHKDSTHDK